MNMLTPFGTRLREERLRLGLNQEQFGDKAGVSKNSISSYEKGERSATVVFLMILEDIGVDIAYVLTGNRNDGRLSGEHKQLFDMFDKCSTREREAVMSLLMHLTGHTVTLDELGAKKPETVHDSRTGFKSQE